jgi:AcrR family transcriptional regulator
LNARTRSYHHGDLHNALIIAAAELIESQQSLHFSMSDAAKRAGVSSAAPYRHFKDKDALLEAVRDLAFLGLNQRMLEAARAEPAGSVAQIIALGNAYIDYARDKQAFFALMWEASGDMASRQESARTKAAGFQVLVAALEQYIARHAPRSAYPILRLATQMWSMVHGIATLECNQMLDTFDPDIQSRQLVVEGTRALLQTLVDGDSPTAPAQHSLAID